GRPSTAPRRGRGGASRRGRRAGLSSEEAFLDEGADAWLREVGGRPRRLDAAEIEKVDVVGLGQRILDVLVDQEDGGAAGAPRRLQHLVDLADEVGGEPGG